VRILALLVAALVLAAPALASERHPTQGELERELVCPTCHTTLDESDAPVARELKAHIALRIRQGWTKSQIENELVAQFGNSVLGVPRKSGFDLLAWLLPLGGIALGAVAIGAGAWKWSRARSDLPADTVALGTNGASAAAGAADPELERRVDEELARYDA
jgi:cytochrome c-type biogenesis protein CcmH